jgi:drug/metabolite transporter (DMT)-like permease
MTLLIPLLFLPIMLAWSLPNFIFKELTNYYDNSHIIIMYHIVYHIFLLPIILYNVIKKTDEYTIFVENTKKVPLKYKIAVFCISSLGILSQYCYFKLLRRYDITTLLPIIRGGSAIILITLGYYVFDENINLTKIIGILIVMIGMYLVTIA